MTEDDGQDDLSQGKVSDVGEEKANSEILEEAQRRRWKTAVLWSSSVFIVTFYAILIFLVLCRPDTNHWIIGIMAAIPTLLVSKLFQLVSPSFQKENNSIDGSWHQLGRELVRAMKDKS